MARTKARMTKPIISPDPEQRRVEYNVFLKYIETKEGIAQNGNVRLLWAELLEEFQLPAGHAEDYQGRWRQWREYLEPAVYMAAEYGLTFNEAQKWLVGNWDIPQEHRRFERSTLPYFALVERYVRLSDDGAVRLAELEDAHLRAAEEERRVEDERLRNEREQARQQADNNWRREERRRRRLLEEQNQPAGRGGMATAEQIALGQLFRNAVLIDVQIRPSQEDFRTAVNRVQVVSQQVLTPKGMAELSNLFREDRDLTQQYLATDDGADTAEYRYWTIKGWLDTRAGGDAVEARWVVRGNWLDGVFQRL